MTINHRTPFFIRQPGDGKNGMLFMDQGSAKIYNLNEDGKETVLGVLNQGDGSTVPVLQ